MHSGDVGGRHLCGMGSLRYTSRVLTRIEFYASNDESSSRRFRPHRRYLCCVKAHGSRALREQDGEPGSPVAAVVVGGRGTKAELAGAGFRRGVVRGGRRLRGGIRALSAAAGGVSGEVRGAAASAARAAAAPAAGQSLSAAWQSPRASALCVREARTLVRLLRGQRPNNTPTIRWISFCCAVAWRSWHRIRSFRAASIPR